jgi:hypothetical protein
VTISKERLVNRFRRPDVPAAAEANFFEIANPENHSELNRFAVLCCGRQPPAALLLTPCVAPRSAMTRVSAGNCAIITSGRLLRPAMTQQTGFALASVRPPYPGVSDQNSHTLPDEVQIHADPFVQLPISQRVTGNKTFPAVCDQYTIKQVPCQTDKKQNP